MEDLEYSGFWFLPSTPENKVPGILKISSSGRINLKLMGSFQDRAGENLGFHTRLIVLGVTQGKLITLHECSGFAPPFSAPGFLSLEYKARTAFIGGHFTDPSEMLFHKVSVKYRYLPDWYGLSIPSGDFVTGDNGSISGYQLNYDYPPETKLTTAQATISIQHTWTSKGNPLEQRINQSALMLIEAQEKLDLDGWLSRFISPIQNFLSLATDQPNSLESIKAYSNLKQYQITIIFHKSYSETRQEKHLSKEKMLFTFQDIDDFRSLIERWLEISDDLDSVCNLFFSIRYSSQMYLENQFLNVSQALESYHRRRIRNEELPKAEHEKRLEEIMAIMKVMQIMAQAPKEYKEWLEQRLGYSNEPNFRKRISELVDRESDVILPLIGKKKSFVNKVYSTRNYYTHYDLSLKEKAIKGSELYWLVQPLVFLIQVCFLRELRFSSEKIIELMNRNELYQNHLNKSIYET